MSMYSYLKVLFSQQPTCGSTVPASVVPTTYDPFDLKPRVNRHLLDTLNRS